MKNFLLFQIVFCVSVISVERQNGINDCPENNTHLVDVNVTYSAPYQERNVRFCWNIPPQCSYTITKYKILQRTEKRVTNIESMSCCKGYKSARNDSLIDSIYKDCVPDCRDKCKPFGICFAPNQCLCSSGLIKSLCDIEDASYRNISPNSESTKSSSETQSESSVELDEVFSSTDEPEDVNPYDPNSEVTDIIWEYVNELDDSNLSLEASGRQSNVSEDLIVYPEDESSSESELLTLNSTKPLVMNADTLTEANGTIEIFSIIGIFFAFILLAIGIIVVIFRKKMKCEKDLWSKFSFRRKTSKNEEDTKQISQDDKSFSMMSLEPCSFDDDEIKPQSASDRDERDAAPKGGEISALTSSVSSKAEEENINT